ncbi:MAG: hypothetical protein WCK67_07985 [bacterium]
MNNEEFQKIVLEQFNVMNARFDSINKELKAIRTENKLHKLQTSENTEMLKALLHSVEVVKAEQEKTNMDINYIKGSFVTVETMAAQNYTDIVKLKAVGQ